MGRTNRNLLQAHEDRLEDDSQTLFLSHGRSAFFWAQLNFLLIPNRNYDGNHIKPNLA